MRGSSETKFLQELLLYAASAALSCLVLFAGLRQLDPNREASKKALEHKKEIAKRLGRPLIQTNPYEDVIACDVINPDHIDVEFGSIGGLDSIKQALYELVILPLRRPELFSHGKLLGPQKGVLLYGPPGTGKTMLAKAIARESGAVFINVRISNLMSKWFGDAQKLVAAVFSLAYKLQPAIIFIDEVDSFLGQRRTTDHEALTNMKTEFMALWDGFTTDQNAQVMVLAATNRPSELDEAILRRLPQAFEIGMPDQRERAEILKVVLKGEKIENNIDFNYIASLCEGYTGSDLLELCKKAAYFPIREILDEEKKGKNSSAPRPLSQADLQRVLATSTKTGVAANEYSRSSSQSPGWPRQSGGEFLSAALQPPESLAVQNAIGFLKMIGALDEKENLTNLGKYLTMLPVDPKLGKMLIMGAIFRCFGPILTIVSGLSVRDPFLLPQDKKDLAGAAKSRFSAKDYSDHMALVRAYEGWKEAEREGSAYEYCWRNFLSAQTLQAIHSLRKQFNFILKDTGLVEEDASSNNKLSHNQSLVRAIICSGLYPGIASVVHRETSMSFKTMDDGQVFLYANSVNARYETIPYPWLVFGEKVKVNTVFIRDSTGVSDSILILFGGALACGVQAGHLKMLDGYIDFFMDHTLAECFLKLKEELDKLLQKKLQDPNLDILKEGKYLMLAVQELVSGDQCEGRFVFGRESKKPKIINDNDRFTKDGANPKSLLQTLLMRSGHSPPKYKTKHLKTNEFRALVEFKGMQFVGKPKRNKQLAEGDAAIEALAWLTHTSNNNQNEHDDSQPDVTDNMLKLLGKRRRSKRHSG